MGADRLHNFMQTVRILCGIGPKWISPKARQQRFSKGSPGMTGRGYSGRIPRFRAMRMTGKGHTERNFVLSSFMSMRATARDKSEVRGCRGVANH